MFLGGRDTAGLGGKGGPYRLYGGGDVYQISDEEKEAVPEEVTVKFHYSVHLIYFSLYLSTEWYMQKELLIRSLKQFTCMYQYACM